MGLFGRKGDPEKDLAKALALRGAQGRATVVSMRETGNERDGVAKEIAFVLDLEVPDQGTVRVETAQYMNRYTLHKLAPGEPARVMYDRDDPQKVLVEGHARYRTDIVANEIVVVEVEDVR
ncbi:MAG TPA: hypothetical protein VN522_07425 [Solirubrobacterales bacterium]|nr:hypothetical protein [Solirubrobacterales bacterium]